MRAKKGLAHRLVMRALRENLPRGPRLPEMGDTLLELGLDSLDRETLSLALQEDLALEMTEEEEREAWADVVGGGITLGELIRKVEAMAGR